MSGKTLILLLIFKLSFTMQTILTSTLNMKIILFANEFQLSDNLYTMEY